MTAGSFQRTAALMRKLFEILAIEPDGLAARKALERLEMAMPPNEYEAGVYKDGSRRFEKIVRFASIDCVKAGWLTKHKGTWSLTEDGSTALSDYAQPETFYREAVRLYWEWKRAQGVAEGPPPPEPPDIEVDESTKASSITYEQAEEQAWGEIEAYLGSMSPYEFQQLCADLLKAMGYYPSWVAPPGKDGGIDIIAYPDPIGASSPRIKVQVKRQKDSVRAGGLREFLSLINEGDAGIFVSLGGFSRDAQDEARKEHRRIMLLDGEKLVELWIEFYGKLDQVARERLPLTPIHFLTPRA